MIMREIEYTRQFRRDIKRERKSYGQSLEDDLLAVIESLVKDEPLDQKFRDHALTGNWKDSRDCHIKPDLVLIYQKPNQTHLILVRLGSHSTLRI